MSRGITLILRDADGAVLSDGQERQPSSTSLSFHFDIVSASGNGTVDGCLVPRLAIAVCFDDRNISSSRM